MNILILEINNLHTRKIESYLKYASCFYNLYTCNTIEQAIHTAENHEIDLFLLTIKLENESGLDFAAYLRMNKKYSMTWLIFITSDPSYINEAYQDFHCYYYFLIPYDPSDLIEKVDNLLRFEVKIRESENDNHAILDIYNKGINYRIYANSIVFIEVNYKSLYVIATDMTYYFSRYTLERIRNILPQNMFLQCHRSYIINKTRIKSLHLQQDAAYIDMGYKSIPVGTNYRTSIKKELFNN